MALLTIVSTVVAFLCAGIAWRARHEQRRRSEARVAALAAAIDPSAGESALIFSPSHSSYAHEHPVFKIAAGFVLVVSIILVVAIVSDHRSDEPVFSGASTSPLELLSMRHERLGDTLTVTGLVRNHGATSAEGITATVFAFDRAGAFVASGRAPLDLGTLAAGEQSAFRVAIPHVTNVGRYQVSFRNAAGLVRHVDRRHTVSGSTTVDARRTSATRAAATAQ
jgi:hypothetical protein